MARMKHVACAYRALRCGGGNAPAWPHAQLVVHCTTLTQADGSAGQRPRDAGIILIDIFPPKLLIRVLENRVPTKPIATSRYLVIGMRSFAGSRTALLNVAVRLLTASKALELGGGASLYRCFEDEQGRDFLSAAVLYCSQLPLDSLSDLIRRVETSLQDPLGDPARRAIELRLLWLEGVQDENPTSKLPSPLLMTHRWASLAFVEAAEEALIAAVERQTESRSILTTIANAYVRLKKAGENPKWVFAIGGLCGKRFERTLGGVVLKTAAIDSPDLLASAVDLMLIAESDAYRIAKKLVTLAASSPGSGAEEALKKTPPSVVVPVVANVQRQALDSDRTSIWLNTTRHVAVREALDVTEAIVWADTDSTIRGALLGKKTDRVSWLRAIAGVHVSKLALSVVPTINLSLTLSD